MTEDEKKEVKDMMKAMLEDSMESVNKTVAQAVSALGEKQSEILKTKLEESQALNRELLKKMGNDKTLEERIYESMGGKL